MRNKKTTLKNKADALFSKLIRKDGVCDLYGLDKITCAGSLQCCHIVGRANMRLRYDTMNALAACQGHHVYYTNHPWEWQELIRKWFVDRYEYVNEHREEKIYNMDFTQVIEKLEQELKNVT